MELFVALGYIVINTFWYCNILTHGTILMHIGFKTIKQLHTWTISQFSSSSRITIGYHPRICFISNNESVGQLSSSWCKPQVAGVFAGRGILPSFNAMDPIQRSEIQSGPFLYSNVQIQMCELLPKNLSFRTSSLSQTCRVRSAGTLTSTGSISKAFFWEYTTLSSWRIYLKGNTKRQLKLPSPERDL